MALIQMNMYSSALTTATTVNIVVPLENNARKKYPVVWLLPPFGMDYTAWLRNTGIEHIAEKYNFIAAMPSLSHSFGVDMAHGLKYYTMLQKELPLLLAEYFPVNLAKQYIVGIREGGYAALRTALLNDDFYRAALTIGCGSITDEDFDIEKQKYILNAFGNKEISKLKNTNYDLTMLLDKAEGSNTKFYLAYGFYDNYKKSILELSKHIKDTNIKILEKCSSWKECEKALGWFLKEMDVTLKH